MSPLRFGATARQGMGVRVRSPLPVRAAPGRRPRYPAAPWWALLLLLPFACLAEAPAGPAEDMTPAEREAEAKACLVCHKMATIAYRDPQTAEIVDLHVDGRAFAHSNHADLACTKCHKPSFRDYPHRHGSADEALHCIDCHDDDDEKFARYRFKEVQKELDRSVHMTEEVERFSCFSCHNPHYFRVVQPGDDVTAIVAGHNRVCMSCHAEKPATMALAHEWLPNREAHWLKVRCLECHTPASDLPSHEVLPANRSVRTCVECHAKDATLLNRLYTYRAEEEVEQKGLLSLAVFNRAYVVGMSRSPLLDRLALALIVLMVAVFAAHGVGRYLAYRASRRQQ